MKHSAVVTYSNFYNNQLCYHANCEMRCVIYTAIIYFLFKGQIAVQKHQVMETKQHLSD